MLMRAFQSFRAPLVCHFVIRDTIPELSGALERAEGVNDFTSCCTCCPPARPLPFGLVQGLLGVSRVDLEQLKGPLR